MNVTEIPFETQLWPLAMVAVPPFVKNVNAHGELASDADDAEIVPLALSTRVRDEVVVSVLVPKIDGLVKVSVTLLVHDHVAANALGVLGVGLTVDPLQPPRTIAEMTARSHLAMVISRDHDSRIESKGESASVPVR